MVRRAGRLGRAGVRVAIQRPLAGEAGSYTALLNISREITTAWNSEAFVAALAMVYVGIDTMALLACPLGKTEQTKKDFILWVDEYLRADPGSDYQYEAFPACNSMVR